MDPLLLKIVSGGAVFVAKRLFEPGTSGANLVSDPVRLGGYIKWIFRRKDVTQRDIHRLVRKLLLRAADADPDIRAIDPNDGERLSNALVASLLAFDTVTMEIAQAVTLKPEKLAAMLTQAADVEPTLLTPETSCLYDTILLLCCGHIIEHFTKMPEFLLRTAVETARNVGTILDLVDREPGFEVWTDADFKVGRYIGPDLDPDEPIELDEQVDVVLLRQGRLPNLQLEFKNLGPVFDEWLDSEPQKKRGSERLRVLWLEGEPGPHRSKALLACLSRAGEKGRAVYDAGSELDLAARALERSILTTVLPIPPLVSADLGADHASTAWSRVRRALRARPQLSNKIDPYPRMIVAGTAAQGQAAHKALGSLVEIKSIDTNGRDRQRAYSFHGATGMESESLTAEHAVERHVTATLGPKLVMDRRSAELRTVIEYFSDRRVGQFHDPRKHAVALTFVASCEGEADPTGEALAFEWFKIDDLTEVQFGFGQGGAVARVLAAREIFVSPEA